MKKVIHFKFGKYDSLKSVNCFAKYLVKYLPDYIVILTPYDVTFEDENDLALSLNGINYTYKQLEEMLNG